MKVTIDLNTKRRLGMFNRMVSLAEREVISAEHKDADDRAFMKFLDTMRNLTKGA